MDVWAAANREPVAKPAAQVIISIAFLPAPEDRSIQLRWTVLPTLAKAMLRHYMTHDAALNVGRQKYFCRRILQRGIVQQRIGQHEPESREGLNPEWHEKTA